MAPRCPVPLQGGPAFLPGVSLGGDWTREVSLCTWAVGRPHTLSAVRGAVGCDPGHPLPPSSSGLPEGSALVHRREDGNRPPRGLSGGKGCVCHVTPWMGQPSRSTGCLQSGKPTLGRQHVLTDQSRTCQGRTANSLHNRQVNRRRRNSPVQEWTEALHGLFHRDDTHMAHARGEGHTTSLVLRESQTKATARHHHPYGDGSDRKERRRAPQTWGGRAPCCCWSPGCPSPERGPWGSGVHSAEPLPEDSGRLPDRDAGPAR